MHLLRLLVLVFACVAREHATSAAPVTISCLPNSRFTVVSPRVIRLEYVADPARQRFEDRSSTAFAHRMSLPSSSLTVKNDTAEWCNVSVNVEPYLELSFRKSPQLPTTETVEDDEATAYFKRHQLAVSSGEKSPFSWKAGAEPSNNLLGTIGLSTGKLAGANVSGPDLRGCCTNPDYPHTFDPEHELKHGIISRDGWSLIDDSFTELIANGTGDFDHGWIDSEGRQKDSVDWYFFGCGLDYAACLEEFVSVSGRISVPTKHALGVWWSRHWGDPFDHNPFGPMTESAILNEVVDGYMKRDLPLNVVVLDMEWHTQTKFPQCDTFLGIKGWGGYTFNKTLFPDPNKFIDKIHEKDIHIALNLHPDGTIDACQEPYVKLAEALGVDPSTKVALPDLDASQKNQSYCDAHFTYCIEPLNMDIVWTDTPSATAWSNYLYVRYPALRKNKRVINFSRYAGIGDQRKPIGFSGDTLRQFDTLQYEVYMTPRAGNVGFGWWSHDIGGFSGGYVNNTNHTESPELFCRWLQFATFAPIFRTHCRFCEQRIWTFGERWYPLMKATMVERHRLFPYINTHAHLYTYQKGRSLLTPIYWSSEKAASMDEAYEAKYTNTQYLFGMHFLVAPITVPLATTTSKPIWLPPGEWVNWHNATEVYHGPQELLLNDLKLEDTPVYVNTSSIIPIQADFKYNETNQGNSMTFAIADPVIWVVFVHGSASSAHGELFEDDGITMDYRKMASSGLHTRVKANIKRRPQLNPGMGATPPTRLLCRVESKIGHDVSQDMLLTIPKLRQHWFKLVGVAKNVKHVQCGGTSLEERSFGIEGTSGYQMNKEENSLLVNCGGQVVGGEFELVVTF